VRPTWKAKLLVSFGAFLLSFAAIYANAVILHREDITDSRTGHLMVPGIVMLIVVLLPVRRRTFLGSRLCARNPRIDQELPGNISRDRLPFIFSIGEHLLLP
jgi:hypothetical protein